MHRHLKVALATLVVAFAVPSAAQAASPGIVISSFAAANVQAGIDTGAQEITMFVPWQSMQPTENSPIDNAYLKALSDAVDRIHAAGRRTLLIFLGAPGWANGGHADDPDYAPDYAHVPAYADFIASVVKYVKDKSQNGAFVDKVQPWNEPDDPNYWKGPFDLDRYVAMLGQTYDAVKSPDKGDPRTQVFAASTAGGHWQWIDEMLAKVGGKLDGLAVDYDPSCGVDGPDAIYREADGTLGRFTFMSFLEVQRVMAARGVPGLPLIFAVMGISSTNGGPTSCARGSFAGKKPSGVSEDRQAQLLKSLYQCLANYPGVTGANWFRLEDTTGDADSDEFNHYGLFHANPDGTPNFNSPKPSLQAFKEIVAANGGSPAFCADLVPPQINVVAPVQNQQFDDRLDLRASATDDNVGLARISFFVDQQADSIRNFTDGLSNGAIFGLTPWFGSRDLPVGAHTFRFEAVDKNGNKASVSIPVQKVAPGALKATLLARLLSPKKILGKDCKRRFRRGKATCTADFGSLAKPVGATAATPSVQGKVRFEWYWFNAKIAKKNAKLKGKKKQDPWRKLAGGLKPANKRLKMTAKLIKKGKWKVRANYLGAGSYKPFSSKYVTFTIR